jgi:xanthine dehydrogenase FAD-binding subunit
MVDSYRPASLPEALEILANHKVTPYAGGTDLMINPQEDAIYLFLDRMPELKNIVEDDEFIRIGAGCTFTDIIEHQLTPAILREASALLAAPAIRNLATAGGNICNGSPKGDSTLVFYAADARLRLASSQGERVIPIADFFLGRKRTALRADELLVEILMKKAGLDHYYYQKVGARDALAIARVSFAGILSVAGGRIAVCRTAFGAVSDVIISRTDIDAKLTGQTIEAAKAVKETYLAAYDQAIMPIKGRISAEYRKSVCMNLLRDFLESNGI